MQEIRSMMITRLTGDVTLYPGLVPGGVYDRPIRSGQGQGSTPAAFYVDPADPTRLVRLRRCIYIYDGGENASPDGPNNEDDKRARESFPLAYIYVDQTNAGMAALDAIDQRMRFLLDGWQGRTSGGLSVTFSALDRTAAVELEAYPGNVVCFRRYRAEYVQ